MRKVKDIVAEFESKIKDLPKPEQTREALVDFMVDRNPFSKAVLDAMNEILRKDYFEVHKARGNRVESIPGVLRECDTRWRAFTALADDITWDLFGFKGISADAGRGYFSRLADLDKEGLEFDVNFNIVPKGGK